MRDNGIDNQIDETARRLTAGEPGGDLRARVLARIGTSPAEAGRHVPFRYQAVVSGFSRTKWIAVPLALAAALVIVVWSTRSVHQVQQVHEVQQVQRVQGDQQLHEVPQVAEVQRAEHAVNPVNPVNPVNQVNPMAEAESAFAPAPLEIAPLSIAPALVEAIPPAPPIVVADLQVAPIDVRAIDETVAPDRLAQ